MIDVTSIFEKDFNPINLEIGGLSLGSSLNKSIDHFEVVEDHGDWIRTSQGVSFRHRNDESKTLVQFLILPAALIGVKLKKERHIERLLGKPEAIEKSFGFVNYFYPEKQIVVSWHLANNELSGIHIGESKLVLTEFSIKDFFEKYQEFREMVPESSQWNAKSLKYDKPRYYRLLELESLMRAFDIGKDLRNDFLNRGFLRNRTIEDLEPLVQDIEQYWENDEFEQKIKNGRGPREEYISRYEMLIQNLMRFSFEVRSLLRFNSGWLETGSIHSRYSIYKTQKLLRSINLDELEHIEDMLGKLIDPKQQTFRKYYLIEKFDYPDVDMRSIDYDNW